MLVLAKMGFGRLGMELAVEWKAMVAKWPLEELGQLVE